MGTTTSGGGLSRPARPRDAARSLELHVLFLCGKGASDDLVVSPDWRRSPGAGVPVFGQEQQTPRAQSPSGSAWQPTRLSDGQPDVQGTWGAVLGGVFSLTNPMTGGDDFAQRLGGPPVRNPSRIVDPPDGRVPYQPWAAALQERQSIRVGARHAA